MDTKTPDRPFQHLTNRELDRRFGDDGPDHPDFDAIEAEIMRRPAETFDGAAADGDLTGFDQPDQWLDNQRARVLGMSRLSGVFDMMLREEDV